jgi:hypothetical protein
MTPVTVICLSTFMPIEYEYENAVFRAGGVTASVLSLVAGMERHWKYRITFDVVI